ncbi:MAG: SDR family oxidoreductase [Thermoleophilia bacterium]
MGLLDGKVALVTGAARGNGEGIARGLAQHGADVALVDVDGDGAIAAAAAIAADTGRRAIGFAGDVGDPDAAEAMVARTADELGGIHVLVNNAGVLLPEHSLKLTLESWERTLRVNLTGPMLVSVAAARRMAGDGGGAIVNVTSIAAEEGFPGSAAYCASKGGLQMLTRVLAIDLAEHGVRVNAIAPGIIRTPMTEPLYRSEEALARVLAPIPLARQGEPADLVGAAVYLASDLAAWVTGETIRVDGGHTAGFHGWLAG